LLFPSSGRGFTWASGFLFSPTVILVLLTKGVIGLREQRLYLGASCGLAPVLTPAEHVAWDNSIFLPFAFGIFLPLTGPTCSVMG